MDDMFAKAMNSVKKYVVSNTLKSADAWRNSSIISGDVVEEVRKLKELSEKDILSDGSSVLLQKLLKHGLVDELLLHIYPVSLGSGKKLFPIGVKVNLELLESKPLTTGVVFQHYKIRL